jgi:hypothetical protein
MDGDTKQIILTDGTKSHTFNVTPTTDTNSLRRSINTAFGAEVGSVLDTKNVAYPVHSRALFDLATRENQDHHTVQFVKN